MTLPELEKMFLPETRYVPVNAPDFYQVFMTLTPREQRLIIVHGFSTVRLHDQDIDCIVYKGIPIVRMQDMKKYGIVSLFEQIYG